MFTTLWRKFLTLAAGMALLLNATAALAAGELKTDGRFFRDQQGRVVILRGINVGGDSKVPPFRPLDNLSQLDPLAQWGMNVIRLLFNWEAYEPNPGEYDEDYLAYLTSIADGAWQRGIYTIVDFHQDAFSRYVTNGCGEGFPAWATSPYVTPVEPDNGPNCASWATQALFSGEMHQSFHDFYADTAGVRTRYLYLMYRLAENFKNHPGVIGYDLINEPWALEQEELNPLYEDATAVIRNVDPKAIIFVSPHAQTSSGILNTWLNKPSFNNFAYSPHFYDVTATATKFWDGLSLVSDIGWGNMEGKAREWNVPLFVGEFGAPGEGFNLGPYVDLQYRKMNDVLASGAQWVYTPHWDPVLKDGWDVEDFSVVDDQGNFRVNHKIRPYARKIAGTPISTYTTDWGFLSKPSIELKWTHNPAAGKTELFLPRNVIFGSEQLVVEKDGSGLSCSWNSNQTVYSCTSTSVGEKRVKVRTCTWVLWWCL